MAVGLVALPLTAAAQQPDNRLEAVEVQTLSGQQVQFRLRTSGPATTSRKPRAMPSSRISSNSAGDT